jgi:cholesterol 24(S)-hydroxylase
MYLFYFFWSIKLNLFLKKSTISIFFSAGHETTAHSLSAALYYLGKHPDIQQRARDEVIQILGDEPNDVLPSVKQTQSMTFVNQIIKEVKKKKAK